MTTVPGPRGWRLSILGRTHWLTGTVALASDVIPSPNGSFMDWQEVAVSFTNTGLIGKKVYIRCSAQRSKGDVYEVWSTSLTP